MCKAFKSEPYAGDLAPVEEVISRQSEVQVPRCERAQTYLACTSEISISGHLLSCVVVSVLCHTDVVCVVMHTSG